MESEHVEGGREERIKGIKIDWEARKQGKKVRKESKEQRMYVKSARTSEDRDAQEWTRRKRNES
jgi:hypothetical protein